MITWQEFWARDDYIHGKTVNFNIVNSYIKFKPKCILDIGCGFATESKLFQETYGSELYLLDGEFSESNGTRQVRYGSVENMSFYNKITDLKRYYDSQNMQYNFVDANNIQIDENVTFDLVYSFLSCGFHYPANTYMDLINKHTNENSFIIMDIRNLESQQNIEILDEIVAQQKSRKYRIRFV